MILAYFQMCLIFDVSVDEVAIEVTLSSHYHDFINLVLEIILEKLKELVGLEFVFLQCCVHDSHDLRVLVFSEFVVAEQLAQVNVHNHVVVVIERLNDIGFLVQIHLDNIFSTHEQPLLLEQIVPSRLLVVNKNPVDNRESKHWCVKIPDILVIVVFVFLLIAHRIQKHFNLEGVPLGFKFTIIGVIIP